MEKDGAVGKFPKGKYIATVKVGEKGQIVIPKGVRDIFDIEPGDTLLILADIEKGIALVHQDIIGFPGAMLGEEEGDGE